MSNVTHLDDRRPHGKRCYLVAHIDTRTVPPRILGTGLYSESAGSLTGAIGPGVFAFDVMYADGHDYEAAMRAVLGIKEPYRRVYRWALDMLPKDTWKWR